MSRCSLYRRFVVLRVRVRFRLVNTLRLDALTKGVDSASVLVWYCCAHELSRWHRVGEDERRDEKGVDDLVVFSTAYLTAALLIRFYLEFDHRRDGILVSLPRTLLQNVEQLILYDLIWFAGYEPLLFLLTLRRSQDVNRSRYVDSNHTFLCFDFKTSKAFDISSLCSNKWSRTGSETAVDILGGNARWLTIKQFAAWTKERPSDLRLAVLLTGQAEVK